jgi:glycosyltransferase involved in cell wall biosynthesis
LYILGKGPEKENLQVLVGKLQLNRSVTFISQSFPNSEMPHLYSECDVYVQPSVVEPYGIAVLEALACGKPVVGSNIGGMIDTIVEGKSGFLVDPSNPAGLVEKLLMLSDQKLREKFGVFARERVENEFSWDIIGYTYLKHIKKLQA